MCDLGWRLWCQRVLKSSAVVGAASSVLLSWLQNFPHTSTDVLLCDSWRAVLSAPKQELGLVRGSVLAHTGPATCKGCCCLVTFLAAAKAANLHHPRGDAALSFWPQSPSATSGCMMWCRAWTGLARCSILPVFHVNSQLNPTQSPHIHIQTQASSGGRTE